MGLRATSQVAFLYAVSRTSEPCQDGRSRCRAVRRLITATAAAALLAGCSAPVLKASDVKGWPLKSTTAEITCEGGQPIKAKLDNGVTYALNGTTATREGIKPLNHDSGQFLPHPDAELRSFMKFALLDTFNTAADKVCSQ